MSTTRQFTLGCGLVLLLLAICQPKAVDAQFFFPQQQFLQQPRRLNRQGSVSRANSNAFQREIDYGPFGLNQGVSNSRVVTRQNGGQRNGGVTSVARSNALSRELNLGGLDLGSKLTRTQTRTNGAVSRGIAQEFNVGNLGFGGSVSPENLRRGFGLSRDPNGGADLNLGLLSFNLDRNQQQNNQDALTQAQVNAQGRGARARANSNSNSQSRQFGGLQVTDSRSRSNAFGRVRNGQTSANTGGIAGDAFTNANGFGQPFYRSRRGTFGGLSFGPQLFFARPKRHAQFSPFQYPNYGFQAQQQRPFRRQPGGFFFPGDINAQSQGVAENKGELFNQQAGTNSHSNQHTTIDGFSQDNGASSIGSNLANDGTSGQVSSANVNNQYQQNADGGSSSTNGAQSQALNFDPNQQQASSANAGTTHTQTLNGEDIKSHGNSQSTNNNPFGSSSNTANTNANVVRDGNSERVTADSSSQSIFQGANGQNAGANTNANVNSQRGPDGFVSNSASSSATATSQGGSDANASASASSIAGGGGNNAFTNANANAGGFNNFGGFGGFGNGRGNGFGGFGGFRGSGGAQANSGANGGWWRG